MYGRLHEYYIYIDNASFQGSGGSLTSDHTTRLIMFNVISIRYITTLLCFVLSRSTEESVATVHDLAETLYFQVKQISFLKAED